MRKFILLLCFPYYVSAQKAAIVDIDSVILTMPEIKKAKARIDSVVYVLQKKLDALSDSLAEKIDSIKATVKPGEKVKPELVKQIDDAQKKLEDWQANAEKYLQKFQAELRVPFEKKAKEISLIVAKENGYSALVDCSVRGKGILYSEDPPVEITQLVIKRLKTKKP